MISISSISTAGSTIVISILSDLSPAVAAIVTVPAFNKVTTPSLTVATSSSLDSHNTSLLVAFSGNTLAVNVISSPTTPSLDPEILISSTNTTFSFTVISIVSFLVSAVAVIVTVPAFNNVTTPSLTVATSSSLDSHKTSLLVAFSGNTLAVNVISSPTIPKLLPSILIELTLISSSSFGVTTILIVDVIS